MRENVGDFAGVAIGSFCGRYTRIEDVRASVGFRANISYIETRASFAAAAVLNFPSERGPGIKHKSARARGNLSETCIVYCTTTPPRFPPHSVAFFVNTSPCVYAPSWALYAGDKRYTEIAIMGFFFTVPVCSGPEVLAIFWSCTVRSRERNLVIRRCIFDGRDCRFISMLLFSHELNNFFIASTVAAKAFVCSRD